MKQRNNEGNVVPIRLYGDKCLRNVSSEVKEIDSEIRQIIGDLIETMYVKDGVGLAAPQIGKNVRIFVIDPQWFQTNERKPTVFINPKFIKMHGMEAGDEGCLSLPELFAEVPRAQEVVIEAKNEKGELVRYQAEGIFARAVQHEYDHLDGVLFIDRIPKMKRQALKIKLKKIERLTNTDGVNTDENLKDENEQK